MHEAPQQQPKPRPGGPGRAQVIVALTLGIAAAGISHVLGLPTWAQFLVAMAVIAAAGKAMKPLPPRQDGPPAGVEPPQQ